MVLETIYVVRHGYRSNWVVDPATGTYATTIKSPTGIASDPALASYGEEQAQQLADRIATLDPPVDVVYSSPFYRCLQTLKPTMKTLTENGSLKGERAHVRVDNGISEFFGMARFTHPIPATVPALSEHFPYISSEHRASIFPSANGETIPALHDRYAYALHRIISALDADPAGPKTALLCTHAAGMICIGRALTGRMPEKEEEEDFNCGTCSLSVFKRRKTASRTGEADARKEQEEEEVVEEWDERQPDHIPRVAWRDGKGIMGGWECTVNGDCSHLTNGEERSWSFAMVDSQSYETKASATTAKPADTTASAHEPTSLKQEADDLSAGREEKEEMDAKALLEKSSA